MIFVKPLPQIGVVPIYLCIVKLKVCITKKIYYDSND